MSSPWKSREEFKKQKDLEEARKAGNAPAEVDEDGRDINPHIPQYIMKAPWYVDTNKPSLKHQRSTAVQEKEGNKIGMWYNKGATMGESAKKYRKGACENCGAMTHRTKDCCERPRKTGAKYTGKDIKPDELIEKIEMDYDAKRDPYNGYDPESFKEVMELYEKADAERKKKKLQELMKQHGGAENGAKPTTEELSKQIEEEEENDTYNAENIAMIQKRDPKSRTTIRNLRIREDTAKYLYNLDLDSAFYEPKSRSMRENPLAGVQGKKDDLAFAGDNFTRTSGDTTKFRDMQLFAWEAHDKGQDVDISSAPTQAACLHKEFQLKKQQLKDQKKKIILGKYGGEEHLKGEDDTNATENTDTVQSSETYNEYSSTGKLIKGEEVVVKSKYEEDVLLGNHTSVWGSYWEDGQWGYQCCKQLVKLAYCTGEHGRKLKEQKLEIPPPQQPIELNNTPSSANHHTKDSSEKESTEKKKKALQKAIKEQERTNKLDEKELFNERKSKYNSLNQKYDVTEEEMEAYNLKRKRSDDPLANYLDD